MACRFSELGVDSRDPEALAVFWSAVLDYAVIGRDQDAELDRLLRLGAEPADAGQTGDETRRVLADPEGNHFCLLRRRLDPL